MANNNDAPNQKPQALVVGINKYQNREFANLQVPGVNARYMEVRLHNKGNFEVETLDKVTRKQLKEHIVKLFKPKGHYPKIALLYFSGYVYVKDEGIKEVFLTTSDSDPSEDYELGVSLRWLNQLLKESSVEQQIIILDCCYHEEQKLEIDKFISGYQNGKDRFILISFHKDNTEFLRKNNVCSFLTNAILNTLKEDGEQSCTDNKTLIKVLKKQYENRLRDYGDYKRISFGKKINIIVHSSAKNNQENTTSDSNTNQRLNPYKGLAYFEYEDAEYFYGRQKLTDELLERVRKNNFLAVMGASGSGKSSVIRAGLVYQLKLGEQISGSDNWIISIFQPGNYPLQSLAEALAKEILVSEFEDSEDQIQEKIAEAKEYIDRGSDGLEKLIRQAKKRVVIVIDQFEEVFIHCDDDKEKEKFLECLLNTLQKVENNKLCLVLVFRSDFFGRCAEQEYYGLARKIQQHLVAVTPMDEDELKDAIEGPANELGVNVASKLKRELVAEVKTEPGSLPLLQYFLEKNWEENQKIWQLENPKKLVNRINKPWNRVLEEYANSVHKSLSEKERSIAKYIFLKLTYLGEGTGTGDTRKKTAASELKNTSRYQEEDINRVKQKLIDNKLIVSFKEKSNHGTEVEFVNLVHDALIIHWSKLRFWIAEYRLYSKTKQYIEQEAQKWEASKRDISYLYRGEKLKDIEKSMKKYGDILALKQLAKTFIQASIEHRDEQELKQEQERQRKDRRYRNDIFRIIGVLFVVIVLIGIIVFSNWSSDRASTEQNKRYLSNQSVALISYSKTLFNEKRQFDALIEALRAIVPLKKQELPLPENIKPVLRQAVDGVKERDRLQGHNGSIYNVAFSPDGKRLASGSLDKTIKLWNVETGKEILPRLSEHKRKVYNVIFNPEDSTQLASSSADGTIRLWNLETSKYGEYKTLTGHKGKVYSLSFNQDGNILASSSIDTTIKLWNVKTGKEIVPPLTGHKSKVYSVSFNPQNKTQLASGSADGSVRLWNLVTGESKILSNRDYNVYTVSYSPDGKKLASGSTDGTVHIWNLETGKEFNTLNRHQFSVHSVSFSLDSKTLASGSFDNTIKLWDVATGKEITTIAAHKDWVYNVSFNPKYGKKILASGSADGTIRLWDIDKVQSIATFIGHKNWVNSVVFNPQNDTQLASASVDGTVKLWNVTTGKKRTISTKHKRINSVSFSHDGKILASSSANGSIQLWNTQTLQEIEPSLAGHNNWVNSLSFNPKDSTKLASGSNDQTIKVWDIKTGKLIYPPLKGRSEFSAVSFSFDGKTLAAASFDNTIKLWDAKTGKEKPSLKGHKNKVSSISFSRDSKFLVSGSYDKTVKIWNLETGKFLTLKGHTAKVESVSFSPNGRIVASGSADKTIKLWDAHTGKEIKTFAEHENDVLSLSFNSQGTILASGSADDKIILWKIPSDDEITSAENVNLDLLINQGCDWALSYLENNPNVSENDKHLCENINPNYS